MYSVILTTMLMAGGEAPTWGWSSCHGCCGCWSCHGCCGWCHGCCGCWSCHGCCGWWHGCCGWCSGCCGCCGGIIVVPSHPVVIGSAAPIGTVYASGNVANVTIQVA